MTLSFAAIDVETANPTHGSICAIGVTVVRDGIAVTTRSMLCRPPAGVDSFSPHNVRIHGIKPGDVAEQPTFAERLPEVLALVGDLPVVAHNARFDMGNLTRACGFTGVPLPMWDFGCTLSWSGQQLRLESYGLANVAQALGVSLDKHHEAGADAAAAAGVALGLARLAGARTLVELARANGACLTRLANR
ncbi:exonuclease domain-containing protein [Nocardia sp. NPDC056952]|uniref:exonuclease domain-containing protein n=1 Tax=Nocardia sp. NPDC056952 TaxID=3345979 RepID=UPI0036325080